MVFFEGLIIQQKGAPAYVASFTKESSLDFIELRILLEVHNIEKIISKVDEHLIHLLKGNLEEQLAAINEDVYDVFIELDREFHLLLASYNNNLECQDLIHRMNTGVNRAFLILSSTVPKSAIEAYHEHVEITDALEKQEVGLARNKMIVHLNNIEKRFLGYYNQRTNQSDI